MKSLTYAYVGRRLKKRDFRQLWITRISAACKINGMNYSTFMHGLKVAGIQINRKMLSEMAIYDAPAFAALCDIAKKAYITIIKARGGGCAVGWGGKGGEISGEPHVRGDKG